MLNLNQFAALTFDCYGTLIDWETGILTALHHILSAHGKTVDDATLLKLYGDFEQLSEEGELALSSALFPATGKRSTFPIRWPDGNPGPTRSRRCIVLRRDFVWPSFPTSTTISLPPRAPNLGWNSTR